MTRVVVVVVVVRGQKSVCVRGPPNKKRPANFITTPNKAKHTRYFQPGDRTQTRKPKVGEEDYSFEETKRKARRR